MFKGMGFTFVGPHQTEIEHLWFVITNPDHNGNVVIVNLTSKKNGIKQDLSCPINIGDHPYVIKDSIIHYIKAQIKPVSWIEENIYHKNFRRNVEADNGLINRIIRGAFDSKFTPGYIVEKLQEERDIERFKLGLQSLHANKVVTESIEK